jgi:hypothetical protein
VQSQELALKDSLCCLQLGGKVSGPEVISANMGSFDYVRLAPHFAQDDSGSYNGGPYSGGPYDGGPYDGGPYDGGPYDGGPHDGSSYDCSLMTALL